MKSATQPRIRKILWGRYLLDDWLIWLVAFGHNAMCVKRKRVTDGTFFLYYAFHTLGVKQEYNKIQTLNRCWKYRNKHNQRARHMSCLVNWPAGVQRKPYATQNPRSSCCAMRMNLGQMCTRHELKLHDLVPLEKIIELSICGQKCENSGLFRVRLH